MAAAAPARPPASFTAAVSCVRSTGVVRVLGGYQVARVLALVEGRTARSRGVGNIVHMRGRRRHESRRSDRVRRGLVTREDGSMAPTDEASVSYDALLDVGRALFPGSAWGGPGVLAATG